MLETLRIENVAILEQAELEFGPGLNVLTGETGAGKSIVLGALALLAGGRGRADSLREGAAEAVVEALFDTARLPDLERELSAKGLRGEEARPSGTAAHELVVRRSLGSSGRSRARLGGQLVPVATLAELFGERLEISSQHSSQGLRRSETHGRWLDASGGLLTSRAKVEQRYAELRAVDAELSELRGRQEERLRRRDYLAFQLQEIDEVGLQAGELAEIDGEHDRLAHAAELRDETAAAAAELQGGDEGEGALDRTARSLRRLEAVERRDPQLAPLVEGLRDVELQLRDLGAELERYADRIEADPARLDILESRLGAVERLRRKYGKSEEDIFGQRDSLASELEGLDGADARIESLEVERAKVAKALTRAARTLSKGREKAAVELCARVEATLEDLAMSGARFEVFLEPTEPPAGMPCGATGAELPEFRFSANPGEPLRPLRRVASGGELSRVYLALRGALRREASGMVLVFDEVDAGIGGRTSERVGRALAELARHHQVICITHLPQIAAFGDVHFHVEKVKRKSRTVAQVSRVEGDARVEELARMAGGEKVTEATRKHARSLLDQSGAAASSV